MKQNVLTPGKVQILRKSTTKDILIYGAPLKKLGHEGAHEGAHKVGVAQK